MADNINVGDIGNVSKTIAADDIGSVLYQRVKISQGADGAAVDVSPTAPLHVTGNLTSAGTAVVTGDITGNVAVTGTVIVGDGAGALSVDDAGGSLTVDDGGTTISIDDGGASITVDGTVQVGTVTSVSNVANGNLTSIGNIGNGNLTTVAIVGNIGNGNLTSVTSVGNLVNGSLTSAGNVTSVGNLVNGNLTAVATITNNVKAVGPTAEDSAVATAPVTIGGRAKTDLPAAVSDADVINWLMSKYGQGIVRLALRESQVIQKTTIGNTTETVIATADAAHKLDLHRLLITNTSATSISATLKDATAGTTRAIFGCPGGNVTVGFSGSLPMIQATANNNWTLTASGNVTSLEVTAEFIKAGA